MAKADDPSNPSGHRARLRDRFRKGGPDALQDYELIELILFGAIPRRDVKPLAKALLSRFGSVADTLAAPREQLAEVRVDLDGKAPLSANQRVADEFALIRAAALRFTQANVLDRPVIGSWTELLTYVRSAMAYDQVEQFRVLFLDNKNRLIRDEVQTTGTVNHTPVYPREVVKRALALNASAIILLHNHPSGDPTPSRADIEITKKIVDATRTVDVSVHDHLIVGRGKEVSLRTLGYI